MAPGFGWVEVARGGPWRTGYVGRRPCAGGGDLRACLRPPLEDLGSSRLLSRLDARLSRAQLLVPLALLLITGCRCCFSLSLLSERALEQRLLELHRQCQNHGQNATDRGQPGILP